MQKDSHLIKMDQCPTCAKKGKDRGKNNLGIYSDGHQWCFSCGYYLPTNPIQRIKTQVQDVEPVYKGITLPADFGNEIPKDAYEWLKQYDIPDTTIKRRLIGWSESWQRLIFPYFIEGELVAWQGRYFGNDPIRQKRQKWFSQGPLENILYVLGVKTTTLCLVEDIVSAIKLCPYVQTSPLFGSVISAKRFSRLSKFYTDVIIWLDPDKYKEAIKFANLGRTFGLNCRVILSDKDPKEHTIDEIKEYLK